MFSVKFGAMPALGQFCRGIIEASWLTALVCVPLFFAFSGESMQTAKSYLMRSLAIVLLAAWIVEVLAEDTRNLRRSWRRLCDRGTWKTPLMIPVALNTAAVLLATAFSLLPWESFWGASGRREGSLSYLACLLFFSGIVAHVRSKSQVERMMTVILLSSVPITLYAIAQKFSLEPIVVLSGGGTFRVGSTLGQPIFLGAYLIMVFFLSCGRVLSIWTGGSGGMGVRRQRLFALGAYSAIGVLVVVGVACTLSRGPILGLIAGSAMMWLMLAVYWSRRWMVAGAVGLALALIGGLALLAWTPSSLIDLERHPALDRFAGILRPQTGSSGRDAIWRAAAEAASFSRVVEYVDGRADRFKMMRPLVGYGPEQFGPVSQLYHLREFNLAMKGHLYFDRSHNDLWDTLLLTGWLGLLAWLALTLCIPYYACRWVGLVSNRNLRRRFWGLVLIGGVLGCLVFQVWQGAGFMGLGLRLGTVGGLLAYLGWVAWSQQVDRSSQKVPSSQTFLVMAFSAAIVAHLTEIAFSFPVESTSLYFWVFAAVLWVVGERFGGEAASGIIRNKLDQTNGTQKVHDRAQLKSGAPGESGFLAWVSARRTEVFVGCLTALVLVNLGATLLHHTGTTSAVLTVWESVTQVPGQGEQVHVALPLAIIGFWLFLAGIGCMGGGIQERRSWFGSWCVALGCSGALAAIYWATLGYHWAHQIPSSMISLEIARRIFGEHIFAVNFHHAFTLGLIVLMGLCLGERPEAGPVLAQRSTRIGRWAAPIVALAGLVAIHETMLKWFHAGALADSLRSFERQQRWDMAAGLSEAAIAAVPAARSFYLSLASAKIALGMRAADVSQQLEHYARAESALDAGQRMGPLDRSFPLTRGDLYLRWAEDEPVPEAQASRAEHAIEAYQRAAVLDPGNYELWNRMATVALRLLHSPTEAHSNWEHSVELYPGAHTTYGNAAALLVLEARDAETDEQRQRLLRSAAANYQEAMRVTEPNQGGAHYQYASSLGQTHIELREASEALAAYQTALALSPGAERWMNEEKVARLYANLGDKPNALDYTARAIELAPAAQRPGLLTLQNQIMALP